MKSYLVLIVVTSVQPLEEFSFTNSAQSFPAKFYRCPNDFFRCLLNGLSLDSFSADSFREQSSFYAKGVGTVCNAAHFFGPSAPGVVSAVDNGVFGAFEGIAAGRTSFLLCQCMHNLLIFCWQNFRISHITYL